MHLYANLSWNFKHCIPESHIKNCFFSLMKAFCQDKISLNNLFSERKILTYICINWGNLVFFVSSGILVE